MSTAVTKRRIGIVGTVVLALVASLLVYVASRSDGEIVRKADLHDGGIWVTNAEQARFGRINQAANQLDAGVLSDGTTGSGLDIYQDGAAIVGLSRASNQITPINPAEASLAESQSIVLPKAAAVTGARVFATGPVDLRGGTIAMIDPATGGVRAQRIDGRAGIDSLDQLQTQAKPLTTVGANAVVAVGVDGRVYAFSAEKGLLQILAPQGAGFAKPVSVDLGFSTKSAQVTAVGDTWVVYDAVSGRLYADGLEQPEVLSVGGSGDPGAPRYAALQQPGPHAGTVLVQDESGLTQAPLTEAATAAAGITLAQGGAAGSPAGARLMLSAPVRLGSCIHAAWAGPSNAYYGRNCGTDKDTETVDLGAMKKGVRTDGVKLRVNRGLIILNDLDSGDVWDVENNRIKIDNWNSVIPPPQTDDRNKKKDENLVDNEVSRTPPKAMPDSMQVRPGRTSTLHVLDNDSDSQGSILAISPADVTTADLKGVEVSASADGQTIQVTVPAEPAASTFSFQYTVNNGTTAKNGRATAKVTVKVVGPDVNTSPKVRTGQSNLAAAKYPVVQGGLVKVGVIADWRDAENDPIQIEPVDATVGVDGSGALTIKAQGTKGDQVIEYAAADGRRGATRSGVTLSVLGPEDRAIAPRTQPDVLRAVAGKPIQLQPLGNDIPGADPTDPDAPMRLASDVKGPGQLTIDTNLSTNVLTVTGRTPGTSTITYAAQSGSTVSVGRVRVDILPNPDADVPPVATPDSAVLRGQSPVISDVLSNDYSPRSDVLVVQRVTTDDAWLRASVVQGRWVRAEATAPLGGSDERRGVITYTISDGTRTAQGELTVVQKPLQKEKVVPTVVDDQAIVRIGDAVTVPVLDNDSMTDGIPLKLDPAGVRVVAGGGQAFASGSVVRYVPDSASITTQQTATLEYSVYPEGLRARSVTGRVTVTITPLPDNVKNPNQPPTARSFSASVTAGDTISITVPTSGVDPDGDLAFVGGIVGEDGGAVDLKYGRVLGFGAATIRYEAYPRSAGTEVIRYALRDRFGLTSEGFVRIGVVQPGDPQPPVAVEDDIVAAPGRTVHADLLANDLISAGDSVQLEDFTKLNDPGVLKDFQRQQDDSFKVVVPAEQEQAKVLTYGITNGLFDPSRSTLTVRGQKDFNNPPIAVDDTAEPKQGETSVVVDVLANDRDLDGDAASLKVSRVVGDGVVIQPDQKVRVTLRPQARVVPYVIEDADGATAMALIYVPAGTNGLPYVVAGKTIKIDADSTAKVSLADYVADPRGGTIKVTSPDTVSTSPVEHLQASVGSDTELTLTSTNGYVGPAALMLEVTNSTDASDQGAQAAYVTIPVQIGPDVPVLRCPGYEVTLAADGPARTFDIPRLCHAWLPDTLSQGGAAYEATWTTGIDRVRLTQQGQGGRQVALRAEAGAKAGSTGIVTINAKGGAERFQVRVRVTSAPAIASLRPAHIEGLIAGTSRTLNLAQYLDSPLGAPSCTITDARVLSGTGVSVTQSGCQLTVSASASGRGDGRISVSVIDAPDRPRAIGEVTVSVRSKPDPTAAPIAAADRIQGSTARVDWRPPTYDGGLPILEWEVQTSGGPAQRCTSSPCTITGLTNGTKYTFTVRSRNAVGWSDPSPASNVVIPDTKPEAVSITTVTPGDRQLVVSWSRPTNDGTPEKQYQIQWVNVGGGGGGGTAKVAAPTLQRALTGLVNNDAYKIRVQALNDAGWGPYGPEVQAQSFGTPATVPAPTLSPRTPTPNDANAQVSITWPATDPNGPPITKYEVYRRTGSGGAWTLVKTASGGSQRVASDTIPYNGQTVQYTVTATNGGPRTSAQANFSSYRADGIPQTPRLNAITTPNADYRANASFALGDSRSTGYDRVTWRTSAGRSGSWTASGGLSGGTAPDLGNTRQSMEIRACNTAGNCSPWSSSVTFHPYGPTQDVPNLRESHNDDSITFTWGTTGSNGRPITVYEIDGDKNAVVGAGTHSTTISGLGYSTTKRIRVRAQAQDSGWGPWTGYVSGTTNAAPPPPKPDVTWVGHGTRCSGDCEVVDGGSRYQCLGSCYHIAYDLKNFEGRVVCHFSGADTNGQAWGPDDGSGLRIQPKNGHNNSTKFYGLASGWVGVSCTGSNGTASNEARPWG